jgi:hypothetical protein
VFGIWGSGEFGVQGANIRFLAMPDLDWFWVWDTGFRVQKSGLRVYG